MPEHTVTEGLKAWTREAEAMLANQRKILSEVDEIEKRSRKTTEIDPSGAVTLGIILGIVGYAQRLKPDAGGND